MLTSTFIRDTEGLREWRDQWDDVAIAARRPFCAPDWMLAWWEHASPPRADLSTIILHEDGKLVGVAPFYVDRGRALVPRVRILASATCTRVEPLARPGREEEVGRALVTALTGWSQLAVLRLEGIPATSPWPPAFRGLWPAGRMWARRDVSRAAPYVPLGDGSFETWFSAKSRNFRQQMGRARRHLASRGAVVRLVTGRSDVGDAVRDFVRLHHQRWAWRGGSGVLNPRVERMVEQAAHALAPQARLRLWTIQVDGDTISSHIFMAAGGEVCYWLGGFDPAWAAERPAMVTLLAALEDAWRRGDSRFDLGSGEQPYKYRFADADESLDWWTFAPHGARYPLVRAALLPQHGYRWAARHVPDRWRDRAKKLVPRAPSWAR